MKQIKVSVLLPSGVTIAQKMAKVKKQIEKEYTKMANITGINAESLKKEMREATELRVSQCLESWSKRIYADVKITEKGEQHNDTF